MKLFLAALAFLILLAWRIELRAIRRRGLARRRHAEELLRQIRPWWQQPPDDGPEGDH